MRASLYLVFLVPILLIAGCTQTGNVIKDAHQDIEQGINESNNITNTENQTPEPSYQAQANQTDNQTFKNTTQAQNTTQNRTVNLCQNVTCVPNQKTCIDDFVSNCSNMCDPSTGHCSNCSPSCAGHEQPVCNLTCGTCRQLNNQSCSCEEIESCCGNGVCESGEDYENCPAECEQPQQPPQNQSQNVYISEIMYNPVQSENYNEWIEIYNPSSSEVNLDGWSLCGKAILSGYVKYPEETILNDNGYMLPAGGRAVITDGGTGTEVYSNFNATGLALHVDASSICGGLTNSNKTITLMDASNNTVDIITYSSSWGANGNGKSLAKTDNQWTEAEPTPGS